MVFIIILFVVVPVLLVWAFWKMQAFAAHRWRAKGSYFCLALEFLLLPVSSLTYIAIFYLRLNDMVVVEGKEIFASDGPGAAAAMWFGAYLLFLAAIVFPLNIWTARMAIRRAP